MVDRNEISLAFRFLDTQNRGKITIEDLKTRLAVFYPDMKPAELEFFLNLQVFYNLSVLP